MSTLAATQALFWQALSSQMPGDAAIAHHFVGRDPLAARERLEIYRDMYRWRLIDVLAETYANTFKLVGSDAFTRVAAAYIEAHPSTHFSVGNVGRALPAFLVEQGARCGVERADAACMARLEWERDSAFSAAPASSVTAQAMADLGEDRLGAARLRFVPALRVVWCGYDVVETWRSVEAGEPPPTPDAGRTCLAVWRPEFLVYHTRLDPLAADALEAAREGAPLAVICETFAACDAPIERAFAAIGAWFADGWVAAVEVP